MKKYYDEKPQKGHFLRIEIDGIWSVEDFGKFFLYLHDIYNLNFLLQSWEKPHFAFDVKRIQYGSPGSIDILGIGEILKQIKEILVIFIEYRDSHKKHEIENKKLQIEATSVSAT